MGSTLLKLSPNALGSLYMVIGSLGYVINDGFVRRDDGPGIYQVLFIRNLGLAALFFAAIVRMDFANAQAILQVTPFAVTLAAAVVSASGSLASSTWPSCSGSSAY